jgi:drug/metabolite transporter (DMT)-like permease
VDLHLISLRSALGLLYLITFGSVIAFTAYTWLLQHFSATLVATHSFVNPLVAVLAGWLWASEPMNVRIIVATPVILGAIVLIQRGSKHAGMPAEAVQSD